MLEQCKTFSIFLARLFQANLKFVYELYHLVKTCNCVIRFGL